MFCNSCGSAVSPTDFVCPNCGAAQTAKKPVIYPADKIEGWLLFFCVYAAIITPIGWKAVVENMAWRKAPVLTLVDFAIVFAGVVAGIAVWTRSKKALWYVRIYLLSAIVLLVGYLPYLFGMRALAGLTTADRYPFVFVQMLRPVIIALVWWLYFRRSERVRAVFGRNL